MLFITSWWLTCFITGIGTFCPPSPIPPTLYSPEVHWHLGKLKEFPLLLLPFQDQSHTQVSQYRQDPSLIMRSIVHMTDAARSGIMPPAQLTTINQSQLSAQLGLNLGGASLPHTSPSPPASKSATPSPSSSINEEDGDDSSRVSSLRGTEPPREFGIPPQPPHAHVFQFHSWFHLLSLHGFVLAFKCMMIIFFHSFTYFQCNMYSIQIWELWLLLLVGRHWASSFNSGRPNVLNMIKGGARSRLYSKHALVLI